MRAAVLPVVAALAAFAARATPAAEIAPREVEAVVAAETASLDALYRHLHAHPELSLREAESARRMADELRQAGFEVTTGVGGHGVVAVLRNGPGPTVMWRSDMDALPVREETGLPYASRVVVHDDAGREVPVMHACGHDLHMTVLVAAARGLKALAGRWSGTAVLIAQPAEERTAGARAMIQDGLFTKFPRPEAVLALHVSDSLPSGTVGYRSGPALANVDSVDIALFGRGGHGSAPHTTIDPVVMAARLVVGLQTIVAREIDPREPAVVTVGSIHGGTKHNIIPDRVDLQLTVRSYSDEVRKRLLEAIERNAVAEAQAAGAPRRPEIRTGESTPATINDPALTRRVVEALRRGLGADAVQEIAPIMGAEDFTYYGREGVPAFMMMLGTVPAGKVRASRAPGGAPLPSTHSSLYAPEREPSIRTGARAAITAITALLAPR
jgi:hippurate hydrolase